MIMSMWCPPLGNASSCRYKSMRHSVELCPPPTTAILVARRGAPTRDSSEPISFIYEEVCRMRDHDPAFAATYFAIAGGSRGWPPGERMIFSARTINGRRFHKGVM